MFFWQLPETCLTPPRNTSACKSCTDLYGSEDNCWQATRLTSEELLEVREYLCIQAWELTSMFCKCNNFNGSCTKNTIYKCSMQELSWIQSVVTTRSQMITSLFMFSCHQYRTGFPQVSACSWCWTAHLAWAAMWTSTAHLRSPWREMLHTRHGCKAWRGMSGERLGIASRACLLNSSLFWNASGWMDRRVKDHPPIRISYKTRFWCSQDEAHCSKSSRLPNTDRQGRRATAPAIETSSCHRKIWF